MTIRRVATLSLVILAVVFASGAVAAPPKDAIVIGLLAEPVTMDPAPTSSSPASRARGTSRRTGSSIRSPSAPT